MSKSKLESQTESEYLTVNALAELTNADCRHVKRWLNLEQIASRDEDGHKVFEMNAAVACIELHRRRREKSTEMHAANPNAIDPVTKLPWLVAKIREDAIEKRLRNQEEARRQSDEWIDAVSHREVVSAIVNRLEQFPGRMRSELGLTAEQEIGLRKGLDQIRCEAADEIEKTPHANDNEQPS